MKILFVYFNLLLLNVCISQDVHAQRLIAVDTQSAIVCPATELPHGATQVQPPSFAGADCQARSVFNIDPQNMHIWVKTNIHIPDSYINDHTSYAVYLFGKTSSVVYLNGQLLGQNGTPNVIPENEFSGNMDAKFAIPHGLLITGNNEIVLSMSSHHGWLTLHNPLNFVGIGNNLPTKRFFQSDLLYALPLLGVLVLAVIYFATLSFLQNRQSTTVLFFLMSLFVLSQLFFEISRGLFNYSYPIHDLRLLGIVGCALGFGITLMVYIARHLSQYSQLLWVLATALVSLIAVFFTPGFDTKTGLAIFLPALSGMLLTGQRLYQQRDLESALMFISFIVFATTLVLNFGVFHDLIFYYIISFMVCFLFIQQARALVKEQSQRIEESKQVAKLEFKLEQKEQQQSSAKLRISSAGKVDVIDTNNITFCKASGDYVEIYLSTGQLHLFSGSLKSLASQLPSTFLKVHRSYIVNLEAVDSLRTNAVAQTNELLSGAYLMLSNNEKVPVSRRFVPMVRGKVK